MRRRKEGFRGEERVRVRSSSSVLEGGKSEEGLHPRGRGPRATSAGK
jgi:hypothetical protein